MTFAEKFPNNRTSPAAIGMLALNGEYIGQIWVFSRISHSHDIFC